MIAAKPAGLAENTVTGDNEGDRIFAYRCSHRARRLRLAEMGGDVGISRGFADGDPQQGFPNPDLKIGSYQDNAQRGIGLPEIGVEYPTGKGRGAGTVLVIRCIGPARLHVSKGGSFLTFISKRQAA